jgi:hypothetical protein
MRPAYPSKGAVGRRVRRTLEAARFGGKHHRGPAHVLVVRSASPDRGDRDARLPNNCHGPVARTGKPAWRGEREVVLAGKAGRAIARSAAVFLSLGRDWASLGPRDAPVAAVGRFSCFHQVGRVLLPIVRPPAPGGTGGVSQRTKARDIETCHRNTPSTSSCHLGVTCLGGRPPFSPLAAMAAPASSRASVRASSAVRWIDWTAPAIETDSVTGPPLRASTSTRGGSVALSSNPS